MSLTEYAASMEGKPLFTLDEGRETVERRGLWPSGELHERVRTRVLFLFRGFVGPRGRSSPWSSRCR